MALAERTSDKATERRDIAARRLTEILAKTGRDPR
jgi:hypothetical protein